MDSSHLRLATTRACQRRRPGRIAAFECCTFLNRQDSTPDLRCTMMAIRQFDDFRILFQCLALFNLGHNATLPRRNLRNFSKYLRTLTKDSAIQSISSLRADPDLSCLSVSKSTGGNQRIRRLTPFLFDSFVPEMTLGYSALAIGRNGFQSVSDRHRADCVAG